MRKQVFSWIFCQTTLAVQMRLYDFVVKWKEIIFYFKKLLTMKPKMIKAVHYERMYLLCCKLVCLFEQANVFVQARRH